MRSSNNAAAQIRGGLTFILTALATLVVALLIVPAAHADHLPEGITIDPDPAVGVSDPVLTPGANLGPLNLPLPGVLPDLPDLYPIMLTESALLAPGLPAIFIDTYTIPGLILYRFDGVLANIGGSMELYCAFCNLASQTLYQVVWAGGRPPGSQNPLVAPVGAELRNLTVKGGLDVYSNASGHKHWHYDTAAVYEILVPDGPTRRTAKIGFCMYDTYDTISNTNYYPAASSFGWCRPGASNAPIVRMGISPGIGDYYSAQLTDQWIDVTGLDAGTYTLRAEINPERYLDESDFSNNVSTEDRVIPGATASALNVAIAPSTTTTLGLSGAIVAPELFARLGAHCGVWSASCYIDGTGKTFVNAGDGVAKLAFQIVTPPQSGTLGNTGIPTLTGNTTATIGYTAAPGFIGIDTFTYRTIDERSLASNPTTVTIAIGSAPANSASPTVSGSTAIGEALAATPGSWTGDGTIAHTPISGNVATQPVRAVATRQAPRASAIRSAPPTSARP